MERTLSDPAFPLSKHSSHPDFGVLMQVLAKEVEDAEVRGGICPCFMKAGEERGGGGVGGGETGRRHPRFSSCFPPTYLNLMKSSCPQSGWGVIPYITVSCFPKHLSPRATH